MHDSAILIFARVAINLAFEQAAWSAMGQLNGAGGDPASRALCKGCAKC